MGIARHPRETAVCPPRTSRTSFQQVKSRKKAAGAFLPKSNSASLPWWIRHVRKDS